MDGKRRREKIIELMKNSRTPLSGTALAEKFGVSRQVIVQDIALLRAADYSIISTNRVISVKLFRIQSEYFM